MQAAIGTVCLLVSPQPEWNAEQPQECIGLPRAGKWVFKWWHHNTSSIVSTYWNLTNQERIWFCV